MTDLLNKHSFVELGARQRAKALLDADTYRELIDPFQRVMSPWLSRQGGGGSGGGGRLGGRLRCGGGGGDGLVDVEHGRLGEDGVVSGSKEVDLERLSGGEVTSVKADQDMKGQQGRDKVR